MYRFIQRTVEPLKTSSFSGNDKSTSRWQTFPSIRTLKKNYPVIPNVPLIR